MPTRISGACNACRSKKQKCSGDKSGCAQCEAAGVTCTWPEQRKRGPAKGYIEGLEHRLHDAESLLLQLLPQISTEQLQSATSILANQDNIDSGRDSPDRRSSPPILNKKTGIEYWENFPLTTVAGIRSWQQDCKIHRGTSHTNRSNSTKPEVRGSSPASHLLPSEDVRQKRRSLPGQRTTSSASFPGSDASLDELFNMNNSTSRRSSTQVMPQRGDHMQMAMNQQQRSPWQTPQMMSLDHQGQNDITQQQMFTNVGYLNASAGWPAQQNVQMDVDQPQQPVHQQQHPASHVHVPAMTGQAHLFW